MDRPKPPPSRTTSPFENPFRPSSTSSLHSSSPGLTLRPSGSGASDRRLTYDRRASQYPQTPAPQMPPSLPVRPCEVCEEHKTKTYYCVNCDGNFCDPCWDKERPHAQGKSGPDGLPHEKADPLVVNRLKETFTPPNNPKIQQKMHIEDEDTTWFGIARDATNVPIFQDYGRYATLMANSATGELVRYPQLVSFIGQTGAGKSTLVKMLIEQQRIHNNPTAAHLFPTPIVGSVHNDNVPTSGDVHLYADPGTYLGPLPMLYADCEGLEGGENVPIGIRHREAEPGNARKRAESQSDGERSRVKKRWKMARGSQRDIAWANCPETRKRQYAVTELYPRLLYTFSDVIVFVLQNAKTFEATVLSKLLSWASASMEKSLNQPTLPHAIIALNATDTAIDTREWDVDFATHTLLTGVAGAINRDAKYKEYADYWTSKGKAIRTMKDLLECYYSSVRVVRIPKKGRYMLIDEQVTKLHQEISLSCNESFYAKRRARMLSNSDELHVYLQSAFDHFSQNLDTPFNFIEVAFKNNPIPLDFGGNILKLAAAAKNSGACNGGPKIFRELSSMVASCIMLDCNRHNLKGPAEFLLEKYYMEYCDYALDDFCGLFWPCEFSTKRGHCVNVREGHTKGHQNLKGNIIGTGSYVASFTWSSFEEEWLKLLREKVQSIQDSINARILEDRRLTEDRLTSAIHKQNMQEFYRRLGGAEKFNSHSTCFCCLREMPENPLPCGHVLCIPCVKAYGSRRRGCVIQLDACPLHASVPFRSPWSIKYKPDLAGVRILSLDGGGIRGIVELEVLRAIERFMGDKIPIQSFFDLIVGTSTGGIIALGLGVQEWSVETCINKFIRLANKAFTPRLGGMLGTRYKTGPLEQALQESFGNEFLFGGQHDECKGYDTKVAVTASTETGDKAVIFTNYNRELDSQGLYNFIRPDEPDHEMKIWEAARATSAAPTYFKPFFNKRTNEGYVDGAVYYNNPARIAFLESKLLWRDVEDCHPDILLSIGTSHNGQDTTGSAEQRNTLRKRTRDPDLTLLPDTGYRRQRFGQWIKNNAVVQMVQVMVNRVDNILNSEQLWNEFKIWVLDAKAASEGRRYLRINPKLGYRPPRLDEKGQLEGLRATVIDKLRNTNSYRWRIARIVHRLVASTFYFEKREAPRQYEDYHLCKGKIRCRFPNGSNELRNLGAFLTQYQVPNFQPFFRIQEKNRENMAVKIVIPPDVVQKMITIAKFDVDPIEIHISDKLGATTIGLGLLDEHDRKEDVVAISGFPRCLIADNLQKVSTPETNAQERLKVPPKRKSTLRVRPSAAKVEESRRLSTISSNSNSSIGNSLSPNSPLFPEDPEEVKNWVFRRANASNSRPPPQSSNQSSSLYTVSASGPSNLTEVFELPANEMSTSSEQSIQDEQDEDSIALAQAIERSIAEYQKRLTTNPEELQAAIERSKYEM